MESEENQMESPQKQLDTTHVSTKPENTAKVYFWFLVCSLMMFTLPFLTFFLVKNILEEKFHMDGFQNTCWSTLAAVLMVNLIICYYAYLAYLEDKNDHPDSGKLQKKKK